MGHFLKPFWMLAAVVLCVIATIVVVVPVHAGGGIGSAWVTGHSSTAIDIGWSDPDGIDYRYCGDQIKICYKELDDGDPEFACGNGGFTSITTITFSHFVTISGLSPSTRYKFKVFIKAEKLNALNNWKNCEWRKVGTLKQSTDAPPAAPIIDNLAVTGAGQFAIGATVTSNHSGDFDIIRVGYKRTWTHWLLDDAVNRRDRPANVWGERDPRRGWIDMPAASSVSFEIDSLDGCRQYKLVAYGFPAGEQVGVKLGEANGRTGASCKTLDFARLMIDNHEDVLQAYATAVHALYCSPPPPPPSLIAGEATEFSACDSTIVFSHVAAAHPELYADYSAMVAEGDWLGDDYSTIDYLEEEHRDVFDAWQSEPALVAARMNVVNFVARQYPAVYAAIIAETAGEPGVGAHRKVFTMISSFPNPFNPETTIAFSVTSHGPVSVSVFDVAGRLVRKLVDETLDEGSYQRVWDGRDDAGAVVSSGVYFYQLTAGHFSQTRKMVLLK